MKYSLIILAITFLSISCNFSGDKNEEVATPEIVDSLSETSTDEPEMAVVNKPSLWMVEYETATKKEKLKKPSESNAASFTASEMITQLNQNYEDVQLELNKISNDTIFIKIPDSEKLTQQMGSTGSYNYLASVVFNLTELQGMKYVSFDFKEGDHAMPGVFSRDSFQNLR